MKSSSDFFRLLLFVPLALCFSSCDDDEETNGNGPLTTSPKTVTIAANEDAQENFQNALLDAQADEIDTIYLLNGTFSFNRSISLDGADGLLIQGMGPDETILDFSTQSSGAEGLLIANSTRIDLVDLSVRDVPGDAIKARACDKIRFTQVETVWSGEPDMENGAYGLYPVLSTNILIENCYAYGASDAGIYVGQSDRVVVRNSTAEGNVAGIEIENTTNAAVHNNRVTDNTGGILVFDLPDLTQAGSTVAVYNNEIEDNNRINFAPEGNIVAQVPAGTGILILSTKNVEIRDNKILNNNIIGTGVASYLVLDQSEYENYDPYPRNIYIHNNLYSQNPADVTTTQPQMGNLILSIFQDGNIPSLMTDGLLDPNEEITLCFANNGEAAFWNMNFPDYENPSFDITPYLCTGSEVSPTAPDFN